LYGWRKKSRWISEIYPLIVMLKIAYILKWDLLEHYKKSLEEKKDERK
jgi:hypothetical protein